MGSPVSIGTLGDAIRIGLKNGHLVCDGCSFGGPEIPVESVIEHAMFDHVSRCGVIAVREAEIFGGYELGRMLGLSAQTAHEEAWREQNPPT